MDFDLEHWKGQVRGRLREFGTNPKEQLKRAGAQTLFGYLAGMTLFPIAAAAAEGEPVVVLLTLGGIASGMGGKLIVDKFQGWHDEATAAQELEKDTTDSPELRKALDAILDKLDVIETAQAGMSEEDRRWFTSQLGRELQAYPGDFPRVNATLTGVTDSLVITAGGHVSVTYVLNIINMLTPSRLSETESAAGY